MSDKITAYLTQSTETVTSTFTQNGETLVASYVQAARGAKGEDGTGSGGTWGGITGDVSLQTDLGNSATKDVGTTAGTVAAGDDSRFNSGLTPTEHASLSIGTGISEIQFEAIQAGSGGENVQVCIADPVTTQPLTVTAVGNLLTITPSSRANLIVASELQKVDETPFGLNNLVFVSEGLFTADGRDYRLASRPMWARLNVNTGSNYCELYVWPANSNTPGIYTGSTANYMTCGWTVADANPDITPEFQAVESKVSEAVKAVNSIASLATARSGSTGYGPLITQVATNLSL